MLGVILAAGRGTRLGALTDGRSKAMQPIVGQPMIERVMAGLYDNGILRFVVVIHPDDDALYWHLRTGLSFDASVTVVHQEQRLGMAHALQQAAPHVSGEPFIVSACDNLLPEVDLARFFAWWRSRRRLDGLLALMQVSDAQIPSMGIVARAGDTVVRIVEKPRLEEAPSNVASLPLYAFTPRLLDYLDRVEPSPRGEVELQDAIQMLIDDGGEVQGVTVSGRMTVSHPADLLAVNRHYLQLLDGSSSVFIEPGAVIGAGCQIGPEVYVEAGATVGEGACLQRTVVLRGATVPAGAVVTDQVVREDNGGAAPTPPAGG